MNNDNCQLQIFFSYLTHSLFVYTFTSSLIKCTRDGKQHVWERWKIFRRILWQCLMFLSFSKLNRIESIFCVAHTWVSLCVFYSKAAWIDNITEAQLWMKIYYQMRFIDSFFYSHPHKWKMLSSRKSLLTACWLFHLILHKLVIIETEIASNQIHKLTHIKHLIHLCAICDRYWMSE
jgi:hypothetical protein